MGHQSAGFNARLNASVAWRSAVYGFQGASSRTGFYGVPLDTKKPRISGAIKLLLKFIQERRVLYPAIVPPPVVVTVPNSVSRFQARAALYNAGLLSAVEAAIGGADELVKMAWADAQEFRRNSPTILAMASMLELNSSHVDELFIQAAQIEA